MRFADTIYLIHPIELISQHCVDIASVGFMHQWYRIYAIKRTYRSCTVKIIYRLHTLQTFQCALILLWIDADELVEITLK